MIDRQALDKATAYLLSQNIRKPELALVLGSGLGDFADQLNDAVKVKAGDVPFYPSSTVEGHAGILVFGTLKDSGRQSLPIIAFKGRVHFYESGDLDSTLWPVSIAFSLGAKTLLATNAAGGINSAFAEGDLMLIEDFINLSFLHPHAPSQPDSATYFQRRPESFLDATLLKVILDSARDLNINLRRGSYCYLKGPSYETKAEIEMLRRIGADSVGMSTVPEILSAANLGMRIAAISLISNLAAGLSEDRLSHKEVAETAARVKQVFSALLKESILRINN